MNYLILIQGGIGPDVWDKELTISAVDILDATNQAIGKADGLGGHVVSVDQYGTESKPRQICCMYCKLMMDPDKSNELADHILTCAKSPMVSLLKAAAIRMNKMEQALNSIASWRGKIVESFDEPSLATIARECLAECDAEMIPPKSSASPPAPGAS